MRRKPLLLVVLVVPVASLVACSMEAESTEEPTAWVRGRKATAPALELEFVTQGHELVLTKASKRALGANGQTVASQDGIGQHYPVAEGISAMKITFGLGGQMDTRCVIRGANGLETTGECPDAPVGAVVDAKIPETPKLSVVDMNGTYLARDVPIGSTCSTSDNSDCPGNGTSDGVSGTTDGGLTVDQAPGDAGTSLPNPPAECTDVAVRKFVCDWFRARVATSSDPALSSWTFPNCEELVGSNTDAGAYAQQMVAKRAQSGLTNTPKSGCMKYVLPFNVLSQSCYVSKQVATMTWIQRLTGFGENRCHVSPLVIDLDGDGVHLSSSEEGVEFDLVAAGAKTKTAWTDGHDGLLALDRNGNGRIDDGTELFGDISGGDAQENGFSALAKLDDNGDRVIDQRDSRFNALRVWIDANRNGVSEPNELVSLAEAGIATIGVDPDELRGAESRDAFGNHMPLATRATRTNGSSVRVVDAYFR